MPFALVADIGGTNTRVALADGEAIQKGSVERFRNVDNAGLAPVLEAYLSSKGLSAADIDGVCVDIAGPVQDGVGTLTNLDWRVDKNVLRDSLGATRVAVLNDLQAQGHALGRIAEADMIRVIAQPDASENAAKLVINLGTGFNAVPVFDTEFGRFVPPSEAGHVSLPAALPDLLPHLGVLCDRDGYPAVEEVLSGRGVSKVHAALHGEDLAPGDVLDGIAAGDTAALATGRLFVKVFGDVASALALHHLPFGGIYVVGGVIRHFTPHLNTLGFPEAFQAKGRFSRFIGRFGVTVVTDDYAALRGCAAHLARL